MRRFLISAVPAAAGILIATLLVFHFRVRQRDPSVTSEYVEKANSIARPGPLTTAEANDALFRNSSVKAALDRMAFPGRSNQLSAGQVSALNLLGQENHEY